MLAPHLPVVCTWADINSQASLFSLANWRKKPGLGEVDCSGQTHKAAPSTAEWLTHRQTPNTSPSEGRRSHFPTSATPRAFFKEGSHDYESRELSFGCSDLCSCAAGPQLAQAQENPGQL